MRVLGVLAFLIVVGLLIGFVLAPWLLSGQSGEETYQRDNDKLADSLPVFPGAVEIDRRVAAIRSAPGLPAAGYTTRVRYRVRPGTSPRAILHFYRGRMPGWEAYVQPRRGVDVVTGNLRQGSWSATFFRGLARVSVAAGDVPSRRLYVLGADIYGASDD